MRILKYVLLVLFLTGSAGLSFGQRAGGKENPQDKARKVIRRTAVVLHKARKQVKENKNYTGDLAKSVRHQRYAKVLYKKGNYMRAIHHSRLARRLAIASIKANKGNITKPEMDEPSSGKKGPSDDELTKELPSETITDEELINEELQDIDLSETE